MSFPIKCSYTACSGRSQWHRFLGINFTGHSKHAVFQEGRNGTSSGNKFVTGHSKYAVYVCCCLGSEAKDS